jgi:AcrR family transcriptional regulator
MTDASSKMTLRELQKHQTREHLLEVAVSLFAEKGYQATSIDDIIVAAGASRATLYAYFPGKDVLAAELVDRMWADGLRWWRAFGALPDWSRASVLKWLREVIGQYAEVDARHRAAVAASPSGIYLDVSRRRKELVAAVRTNAQLWEGFPRAEADIRALLVVITVEASIADFFEKATIETEVFIGYLTDVLQDLLKAA